MDSLPPIPKPVRHLTLVLSVAIGLSAIAGVGAGLAMPRIDPAQPPNWLLAGMELVVLISAGFGVSLALNRHRDGPGIGLALVAGGVFACSVLASKATLGVIGSFPVRNVLLLRFAAAGLLALAGAHVVLSRDRRAWPIAIRGFFLAVPFAAIVMSTALASRLAPIGQAWNAFWSWPTWLKVMLGGLGTVIAAIAFCAGVHLLIKAFELGRLEEPKNGGADFQPAKE